MGYCQSYTGSKSDMTLLSMRNKSDMTLKVSGLNITFFGPARDTLLSSQDTEKLNFDSNVITTFLNNFIVS